MPLYVDYKQKMGDITLVQEDEGKKQSYKINIYSCNAVAAFIYEYKNEKGEKMVRLMGFIADKQHVKNLLKERFELFTGKVTRVRVNLYYRDMNLLVEYFTKMGVKVTCSYEKPKKKSVTKH